MQCRRFSALSGWTAIAVGLATGCGEPTAPTTLQDSLFSQNGFPAAALSLDQANDVTDGTSFGCGYPPGGNLAQSFTPSGHVLPAVDLRLRAGGTFPAEGFTTTIRIRQGSPAGRVIATGSAFVSDPAVGDQVAVRFDLLPPVRMSAGDPYVIEWESPAAGDGVLTWMGSLSDTYAGGTSFGCVGNATAGRDFSFATYRLGH